MDQPIPVICDRCRAEGFAGDDGFGEIRDLLAFTPVPRRAHADGWREEVQRGFIAALAITGSPRRAARITGRHCNGAEQLRRARGSASFAAAWDAAIELYRERELLRMKNDLAGLAAEQQLSMDRRSAILPAAERAEQESVRPERGEGPSRRLTKREEEDAELDEQRGEYLDGLRRIRDRLTRARRLLLFLIRDDDAKRAAWEVLVGPVDWDKAEHREAQADEPFDDADDPDAEPGAWNMLKPDMLLTAEAGLIAEFTGGHDALAELREQIGETQAEEGPASPPARHPGHDPGPTSD